LPGLPLLAVAVATGLFNIVVTLRSSASAGVAAVASSKQAMGLRFTVPLKDT
jgi:hypothetical protein